MDALFWWTGGLVWSALAVAFAFALVASARDAVLATIYYARFLRRGLRLDVGNLTFRERGRVWWFCFTTSRYTMDKMLKIHRPAAG